MRTETLVLHASLPGPQQCPTTLQPLGVSLLPWAPVGDHLLYERLPCELLPRLNLALVCSSVQCYPHGSPH